MTTGSGDPAVLVLGCAAAALAAALLLPAAPRPGASRGAAPRSWLMPGALLGGVALGWAVAAGALDLPDVLLLVIGTGVVAAAVRLSHTVRERRSVEHRRAQVLEACEGLAADLRSGQPPQRALARAAVVWPELRPVVVAADVGADVPAAMRVLAEVRGAEELADVAAGWQVAHESGTGLAPVLARVVGSLRARRRTARLVAGEVATARATAVVLAALPVPVLAMSAGLGGDPIGFLTGSTPGVLCLAVGLLLAGAGWWWLDRIASGVLGR